MVNTGNVEHVMGALWKGTSSGDWDMDAGLKADPYNQVLEDGMKSTGGKTWGSQVGKTWWFADCDVEKKEGAKETMCWRSHELLKEREETGDIGFHELTLPLPSFRIALFLYAISNIFGKLEVLFYGDF